MQLQPTDEKNFSAVFDGLPFIRACLKSSDETNMKNFNFVFDGLPFITNTTIASATNDEQAFYFFI